MRRGSIVSCLTALLALLVTACIGTRQVPAPGATPELSRITVQNLRVPLDGASLAVRRAASADPVSTLIALHGGPGVASSYMHGLDRLTADGVAVITYDQRGVGGSGLPEVDFSMAAYVEDLAAVQQEAASVPAVVFGHSWGGLLALNYAAAHPERVRALVLFGAAPPTRSALERAAREFEQRLETLQTRGIVPRPLPAGDIYLESIQPAYFSDPTLELPSELVGLKYAPRVNRATWTTLGHYDFRERLRSLDHRVLFFWGRDDPFGEGMARATLRALENAQVETIWLENCGHYWFECPDPFYARLAAFLEADPGGSSSLWRSSKVGLDW